MRKFLINDSAEACVNKISNMVNIINNLCTETSEKYSSDIFLCPRSDEPKIG